MPDYVKAAQRAAQKYGIDPAVFVRQIRAESGFNPNAKSPAGAQGIAQFIPSTAKAYGVNLNDHRVTDDLEGAARYMAANLAKTGGNYHQALSIYNSGRADGYKSIPETRNYVASILNGVTPSSAAPQAPGSVSAGSRAVQTTKTVPGVDRSAERRSLILSFVQQGGARNRNALLGLASQLPSAQDTPARQVTSSKTVPTSSSAPSSSTPTPSGIATFDGKQVAAWIKPALEYARQHGWKGTVNSGYRSFAQQKKIYDSGVRPAAVPGTSNHEGSQYPRGAVDVSDAAGLSAILKRSPYARKLVWAGSKDPVHLSHPHNGSY